MLSWKESSTSYMFQRCFGKSIIKRPGIARSQSYIITAKYLFIPLHYEENFAYPPAGVFFFFFIRCLTRNIEISRLQGYRQLLLLSKDLYSETKKVTGTLDTARWRSFGVEKKSKKSRSINHVHHHQTTTNSMPCCAVACIELYRLGVFPPPLNRLCDAIIATKWSTSQ